MQFTPYTLVFSLHFRGDISGASACGLTTWDPVHRAGPARREPAPLPTFDQELFKKDRVNDEREE